MKEEDLQRLFHRPPGPHALPGWTTANTGRPHPPIPSPSLPSSLRPVPQETPVNSGPRPSGVGEAGKAGKEGQRNRFYQPINTLGLGGGKNSARPPAGWGLQLAPFQQRGETMSWLFLGRGRRPHRPSPTANTEGPSARRESAGSREPKGLERGRAPNPKFGLRGNTAGGAEELYTSP